MKNKITAIIIILCLGLTTIKSQNIYDNPRQRLSPVSPTAFQFIKFGEIPINEYTGSPSIEVPIFNIETKGFSMPVKLQYHSKGIRVTEESDWVGLGWDLSFGSVVQLVNDEDDLSPFFTKSCVPYFSSFWPSTWAYNNTSAPPTSSIYINNDNPADMSNDKTYSFLTIQQYFGGSWTNSPYGPNGWDISSYINFISTITYYNLNGINTKTIDYEKDIFILNTPFEKLYVIIKTTNNETTYVVLNKKGYNVKMDANGGWKVVTPSGVIYYFDEINECNTKTDIGDPAWNQVFGDQNTILEQNTNLINFYNSGINNKISRIWQISKIIDIYGDEIVFNYTQKQLISTTNISTQWKIGNSSQKGYGWDYDPTGYYNQLLKDPYCENVEGPYYSTPSYLFPGLHNTVLVTKVSQTQERSYLSSIKFNNNSINFFISSRSDLTNSRELDSIQVINNKQEKINLIRFRYNYYYSNYQGRGFKTKGNYIGTKESRLRLDTVINHSIDKYTFTYNSEPLPTRNTFAVDYWGFYNGQLNNRSYLTNIVDFEPTNSNITTYANIFSQNTPNIKYAKLNFCKAGVLEKIQYPSGGYTRFCYNLNSFNNYSVPSDPILAIGNSYGNGLRVDSIINYSMENGVYNIKYYKYENGKLQLPVKTFFEKGEYSSEVSQQSNDDGITFAIFSYGGSILNIYSNTLYEANPTGDGTGVGYDVVTKFEINPTNKLAVVNGKIIHNFTNNPDIINFLSTGDLTESVPTYHKGFENGTLLKETILNNSDVKLKETTYNYFLSTNNAIEYNSRVKYLGQWGIDCGYRQILVSYYPLYKPEAILSSKSVMDYFNTGNVTTNETCTYNEYNILKFKGTTASSSNQNIEETYYYPSDIVGNSLYTTEQQNIMQNLIFKNRLNEVIKSENSIRTNGTLTSKTKYIEYDITSNLPKTIKYSLGSSEYFADFSFKYDSKNNIIEKTDRDNISTAYIWGYNSQYPIAEIKNATYAQVSSALGSSPETLAASSSPDMSKVDGLRANSNLAGSLITTYTYKPLIGLTSKTDPRGITTRYLYDSFGRLGLVKDNNLNITGQYRYAYQNVPETNITSGSNATVTGSIIKNDNTYINTNTTASLSITGGSGNFGYNWYLKNSSGVVLQSALNSCSTVFNFTSTVVGALTLQCDVIDYLTNNTITITKQINCGFVPITATIMTNGTSFTSNQPTCTGCITGTATIMVNGGSGSFGYSWALYKNASVIQRGSFSTFDFICPTAGDYIIECLITDYPGATSYTTTKNIRCEH